MNEIIRSIENAQLRSDIPEFAVGDTVELVGPDFRPLSWQVTPMEDMDGIPLSEPRTPQMRFRAKLPAQVPPLSFVRHAVELSGR